MAVRALPELVRKPGKETKTGIEVAKLVIGERTNRCPVIIDAGGGYGADAVNKLGLQGIPAVSFLGQAATIARSRCGTYVFYNKRAEARWRMREELNPEQEFGSAISLPPGAQIKADLAAPTYELHPTRGIKIEDKADIKKRLAGRPVGAVSAQRDHQRDGYLIGRHQDRSEAACASPGGSVGALA
jgi:hypothetical protein